MKTNRYENGKENKNCELRESKYSKIINKSLLLRVTKKYSVSKIREYDEVESEIRIYLKNAGFSVENVDSSAVSIREMVLNALIHGNKLDEAKCVNIGFSINGADLHVEIEDEGDGFNPNNIADPTNWKILKALMQEEEDEILSHGRGIWIAKQYMNVFYNDKGNKVTLTFFNAQEK